MDTTEWDPGTVFDLLGDRLSRCILILARQEPRSAEVLAERLEVSLPTVYRRTNSLVEHDLLTTHHRVDPDNNHYQLFESTLERLTFEIGADGGYEIEIETRSRVGDGFEAFWTDLGAASTGIGADSERGRDSDSDVHVLSRRFSDHL